MNKVRPWGAMDYVELTLLRERDPGWKLLRSDNAPMAIAFLHRVFIERSLRSVSVECFVELLDDELYALNERLGEHKYPKSPKLYLEDWTHADRRWLRKFYPEDGDQPHAELSPAAENGRCDGWSRSSGGATSSAPPRA